MQSLDKQDAFVQEITKTTVKTKVCAFNAHYKCYTVCPKHR